MKRKFLLVALVLLGSLTAIIAQDPQRQQMPVADRVKRTVDRMKPELVLTEQQEKQITPVYTDYYTAMDKLREGGNRPSPEDRKKLNDDRDAKLKTILTEEQMKKMKELEEKMRAERRPGGGGGQ